VLLKLRVFDFGPLAHDPDCDWRVRPLALALQIGLPVIFGARLMTACLTA